MIPRFTAYEFHSEEELNDFLNSLGVSCQMDEPKEEGKDASFAKLMELSEKPTKQFNSKQVDPVMGELAKQDADDLKRVFAKPINPLTGGSVNYYSIQVNNPSIHQAPYRAETADLIDALQLTFNEANIFKEIIRTANARLGNGKLGHTPLYGAEKNAYYANRILAAEQQKSELIVKRGVGKNPLTFKS